MQVPKAAHRIDAVISWVDGEDPRHRVKRQAYIDQQVHPSAQAATRFADQGEIGYSVLSILHFCPFVGRIFIVSDSQYPRSLDALLAERPDWRSRIEVVDHRTIYGEHGDLLPVFSSRSVETMVHRIPGLGEHFIYLNDDFLIGRPLQPDRFFRAGMPVLRAWMTRLPSPIVEQVKAALLRRPPRPGFNLAQQNAARLLGRRRTYLRTGHHPHAMRRSTLAGYFSKRPALLRAQAGHRFRSPEQFSPIALANHLELADGAPVETPRAFGLIKPPRRDRERANFRKTLAALERAELDFLCVQSLDQMTEGDRASVIAALDQCYRIGLPA